MFKKLIQKNNGQALTETALFFALTGLLIMIFFVNLGFIEIVRLRLCMANRFMVYTAAHAKNPDRGRSLIEKVKLMLSNGPPVIANNKNYFNNLQLLTREKSASIAGIKMPIGFRAMEGQICIDYNYNSSIMQKMAGKNGIRLKSDKIVMVKDSLYKGSSFNLIKFLGSK